MLKILKPAKQRKPRKAYKIPDVFYQLPVPCVLWVPFWLAGIVFAYNLFMPFYVAVIVCVVAIGCFVSKRSRVFSLVLLSFVAGYYVYGGSQKFAENHVVRLFELTSPCPLLEGGGEYISEDQSWQAVLFNPNDRRSHLQQYVRGRIVTNKQTTRIAYRYTLELMSFSDMPVSGRVTLFTERDDLKYGDIIETTLFITEQRITNPGEFDFSKLMALSGIYGSARAISPIRHIENNAHPWVLALHQAKSQLRNKIYDSLDYSRPMALSLIFGERRYLQEYDDDFLTDTLPLSGLMHFFAVSGLHVGIIALVVLTVLRLFRLPINVARIVTILFLIFYAFLCNSTPPVVRAVLFFGFYIMAQMSNRLVSKWQILLLSLFIVTLVNPALLFSVSLQFSYLAFIGIIFAIDMVKNITNTEFYDNLKQGFKLPFYRILTYLFIIIFIQLMLIPATVHYFNIINLNVLIGNIVGMVLVSFLLPLFFLILFTPTTFVLFPLFVQVAEFTTAVFNQSIVLLSRMPFVFYHSQRLTELVIMAVFVFMGLMLVVYNTNKRRLWQGAIICIISFAFLVNIPDYKGFKIIFFNVGNADAALIRFSADDYMLIDLANYEGNSRNISRHLIPYLRRENVRSINKVLLTHAHDDHYGGIFRLSSLVQIDTLIVTQRFMNDDVGQRLLNHTNFQNTHFFVLSDTLTLRYRDYSIKFLHPDKDFVHRHENNHSVVCKITYQGLEILFTGDIQLEAERYLLSRYPQYLSANILKAAHHGSRTSSHEQFMRVVNPELFVISATGNVRRGFPNRRVLDIADRTANRTFVTGWDSAVIIKN